MLEKMVAEKKQIIMNVAIRKNILYNIRWI
jgi:hypothetical protein